MMAVRPPVPLADIVIQDAARQGLTISDMAVRVLALHYGYELFPEPTAAQPEVNAAAEPAEQHELPIGA